MKILRIDKIWLDIVLFIALIVIVFIGGNGKYDVMPSKLGEHISLSQQENILQSFFPLKGNVDEIILYGKNVRRHIAGGANRTLISVITPFRLCRIGTCRRLSSG